MLAPTVSGPCHSTGVGRKSPEPSEHAGTAPGPEPEDAVHDDLSERLAVLARDMQRQADAASVVELIVSAVAGTIPGAEEASVTLVHNRRRVVSAAATGQLARRFDDLQQETKEGPCLDAMYQHETVRVDDLASDARWPELSRRATAEMGVASMLCFRLFVHENDLGALNLLARRPGAFTDESERIGLLFAAHAAVAVADAQDLNHMTAALASRDVIGQAKGILMERYRITGEMAFALLAKTSQDSNLKLYDVAEHLSRTGNLGR
jgi:transcriptional regulator with GAF, ATPase, and Fis domain